MPICDCFFHHLPTRHRQRPYAASGQIPQPLVFVANVEENHALACRRLVKSGARLFRDKLKERFPPGSIGFIEDLFAKLLEFFNTDDSDRFGLFYLQHPNPDFALHSCDRLLSRSYQFVPFVD